VGFARSILSSAIAIATTVTPLSCHHCCCHQAIAIILTFAIPITAAAADLTAVIVIVAAAVVTRAQHVVSQKPANGQTQS
jgi:hypothetical protein